MSRGRIVTFIVIGVAAVILFLGVTGRFSPPPQPAPAKTGVNRFTIPVGAAAPMRRGAVDYARLDERIGRLMRDRAMVGLAVGIVEDGQIRFLKGYGVTRAGSSEPVTPGRVPWASLSKCVPPHGRRLARTAGVLGRAVSARFSCAAEGYGTGDVANLFRTPRLFAQRVPSRRRHGPRFCGRAGAGAQYLRARPCNATRTAYDAASEMSSASPAALWPGAARALLRSSA